MFRVSKPPAAAKATIDEAKFGKTVIPVGGATSPSAARPVETARSAPKDILTAHGAIIPISSRLAVAGGRGASVP